MFKLTVKSIHELINLIEKRLIKASDFSNKKLLKELENNASITIKKERPKMILLKEKEYIFNCLINFGYRLYNIDNLKSFIEHLEKKVVSKDEILEYYYSSKSRESKSFSGINLSVFEDTKISLNNKEFILRDFEAGSYFFFYESEVIIPEDVIVVGIENPQTVWYAKRYKQLFENKKVVFLLINDYKNSYVLEWIKKLTNEYIHFGDFDLAGISIYEHKVFPKLIKNKKNSYFIPINIEVYFNSDIGLNELYEKQKCFLNVKSNDTRVQELIVLIKKHKKSIEQENLINKNMIKLK